MNKEIKQIAIVAILVLSMALMRVVNAEFHLYHWVPVAALGIFSGSVLRQGKWAYLIPLMAMFISDIAFSLFTTTQGFYGVSQFVNYAALALVTFLGTQLQNRKTLNIAGFTIAGSLIYFLLSNFGTWLGGYYDMTWSGLVQCFTLAIPFYKSELATGFFVNSLLGDLGFSLVSFTIVYAYKKKLIPALG